MTKMNTIKHSGGIIEISQRSISKIAGFGYLMVFIFGIFGNLFVFEKLIVAGDAATTVNNIVTHQSLFRFGIASWLIVVVFDTIVAWGLYVFLAPVNKSISLLAAVFRLVFVAVFACSFVHYFSVLELVSSANYLKAFEIDYLQAQAMLLISAQEHGVHIAFVFFGLHIFAIGYLIWKSSYVPAILGVLLIVASCGYLIDSFGNFLSYGYANSTTAFVIFVAVPAIISEFSLTVWLLFQNKQV
jgi:hypothetical protein